MSGMSMQQVPRQHEPLRASEIGDALTRVVQGIHLNGLTLKAAKREFEKRFIQCVLQECGGNQSRAAELLGVHRNTLPRMIADLRIDVRRFNLPGTRRQQRKELYASKEPSTTCNYLNGLGRKCGAGICERHTFHLGPDMVRCPHHDPDHGVFVEPLHGAEEAA